MNARQAVEWQFGAWTGLPPSIGWGLLFSASALCVILAAWLYRHTLQSLTRGQRAIFILLRCGFFLALFACLDDTAKNNLREYFQRGGFIFAEDCVNGYGHHGANLSNDYFFRSVVDQLPALLPGSKLEKLPFDHPVFHCFHHFDNGLPHMQGTPHGLHGVTWNGRVVALISPSDLHCGWVDGDAWFGAGKTQQAMEMGINLHVRHDAEGVTLQERSRTVAGYRLDRYRHTSPGARPRPADQLAHS